MCCGSLFWKRIVAFGLTFGLGILTAGLLPRTVINEQKTDQIKADTPKPLSESDKSGKNVDSQSKKNAESKPLCKKYESDAWKLIELKMQVSELKKPSALKNLSVEERKLKLELIRLVERDIAEFEKNIEFEKNRKRSDSPRKFKLAHNLVYVENCEEY